VNLETQKPHGARRTGTCGYSFGKERGAIDVLVVYGLNSTFMATDSENPYASPAGSLQKAGESESDYRLKLFSAKQILAASVIGHIFPASILIAMNYYALTDYKKVTLTVIIGLVYTIIFLLVNDAMSADFIIPYLLLSNVIVFLIPRLLFEKYILYEEQIRPMWLVGVIGSTGLILQFLVYVFIKIMIQEPL
jgi:hypothetical protein